MKTKTNELIGPALDWAVAKSEGKYVTTIAEFTAAWDSASRNNFRHRHEHLGEWIVLGQPGEVQALPKYFTDWAQGGPIIERESLCVGRKHQADTNYCEVNDPAVDCWARTTAGGYLSYGPTPLIAAMRCFVASKLGDEVDVPEELLS